MMPLKFGVLPTRLISSEPGFMPFMPFPLQI